MIRCCGLTKKGKRCAKSTSYQLLIAGVDYDVCHIHSMQSLLSEWEIEIAERVETTTGVGDVPPTIMDWLHAFNECYNETDSSEVTLVNESHNGGECCVCYDTTEIVKTGCDHTLCRTCLKQWTRRSTSCPMCRTRF